MVEIIRADAASAWRERARYDRLLGFDRATWAWECLRRSMNRNPAPPRAAAWRMLRAEPPLCVLTIGRTGWRRMMPLPVMDDLAGFAGHVFWCADELAPVLTVHATPILSGEADAFDVRALDHPVIVLRHRHGGEHILIADGPRCIRIEVRSGTLLSGPVRLNYHLPGDAHVEARLLTLRRLTALCRLGRFPRTLFPPERRARRWAMALQAWDGRQAGASHREIAHVLHGEVAVHHHWYGRSDYMRTQLKRLLRTANTLIDGGWRHLLR